MIRKYSLFSLMAVTALSLSLAACDDNSADQSESAMPAQQEAPMAEAEQVNPTPTLDTVATIVEAQGANAFATADGSTTGAVFLTLHNPQDMPDRLIGASTSVATTVELHESTVDENGVMKMTKVDAIELPARGGVTLAPNGHHIMLIGLTAPLVAGSTFDVMLDFDNASDITVPVAVVSPTGEMPSHDHEGHDHEGHDHGAGETSNESPDAAMSMEETSAPEATTAPAADADASAADAAPADAQDHDHSAH